jgi:hypothetical protein
MREAPGPSCFAALVAVDLEETTVMKITVKTLKPRNPLVAPAQFRRAGSHRPGSRGQRQEGQRALQRELRQMTHSP